MEYHFREREAQLYLNKGEMPRLLSPIDKTVLKAITGQERINGPGIRRKTGLSKMAVLLASYRLSGLGLIVERVSRKRRK